METPKSFFSYTSFKYSTLSSLLFLCLGAVLLSGSANAHRSQILFLVCLVLLMLVWNLLFRLKRFEFYDTHLVIVFPLRSLLPKFTGLYQNRIRKLNYSQIKQIRYYSPRGLPSEPVIHFLLDQPDALRNKEYTFFIYNKAKANELLSRLRQKGIQISIDKTLFPKDQILPQQ